MPCSSDRVDCFAHSFRDLIKQFVSSRVKHLKHNVSQGLPFQTVAAMIRVMVDCPSQLVSLIVESINEGVFTVDKDFHITSFNAAAERIIGIDRSEAIGRPCHEVFKTSICQNRCALKETLATGAPLQDVLIDALNAEMEVIPLSVSTAVLNDESGNMLGGVEIFRDRSEVESLRQELSGKHRFRDIIGRSAVMKEIFALIPQVADSDAPVLVQGPSGSGKELVAQAIHELSGRKDEAFIRVNCGALPDTLLESELFGYERGAFTGAVKKKPGRFQQANQGTLFLDEIGDISPAFQVKLLRALEDGEIQPLGSTQIVKTDVRVICATNRNIEQLVREGTFREDLYYRIKVVPIELPQLRQRREDIPLLIDHFLHLHASRAGRTPPRLSDKTIQLLYDYDYPGNIRELRNIIERAMVLCSSDVIEHYLLPREVLGQERPEMFEPQITPGEARSESSALSKHSPSARSLLSVLEAHQWNRAGAAKALKISRTTLWRKMKEHGLLYSSIIRK